MKFPRLPFHAPVFEDQDQTTEARLTHTILITLLVITFLTGLTPLFVREIVLSPGELYLVLIVSLGLLGGMLILLQCGYVRLTNGVLVSLFWIVITALVFASGGVRSPAFFGYFAAVALAGLLLGGRASLGVAFLCVAAGGGAIYVGQNNLLPSVSLMPPLPILWFSASAYLIILAILQNLAASIMRQALHRARTSESQSRRERDFALQMMNTIGQGLTISGPENVLEFVNPAFAQMLGYPAEELIGKKPADIVFPEDHLILANARTRRLAGETDTYEARLQHANGQMIHTLITAAPRWEEGRVVGSIAVITDLTERKQAEAALERERNLLRTVIDSLPDYIYLKDTKLRCLVSNTANARALGTTPEEIIGKTLADFYPPEEAEHYDAIDRQILATGQPVINQENTFFDVETGRQRWILMSRFPFRSANADLLGILGISHDITARKLVEIALAEQAEETAMLYQVSGKLARAAVNPDDLARQIATIVVEDLHLAECGVWLVDEARRVLRRVAYFGYASQYIPFDISLDGPGLMTIAVHTGELIYVPDVRADPRYLVGDSHTLSEMVVPFRVQERVIGVLNIENPELDAISPRQQRVLAAFAERAALALENVRLVESLETAVAKVQQLNFVLEERVLERTEALEERTAQLEAANKELETFSYSVSHDLRAPLRAINGFSTILMESYASHMPTDAQHFLNRVREGAQRMTQLVDDLLSFSRISRKDLNKRYISPVDLVHEVLDELQGEQVGREIELVIGHLPDCHADPSLLRQVYANLIGNAFKFTRQKSPAHIEIGAQVDNDETVYFVRDNGAGFDMQYGNKLFGVFQRLHTAEEFEGTGIGLANVHRIVTRHGGRIWAEAAVGQGAAFYFTLE